MAADVVCFPLRKWKNMWGAMAALMGDDQVPATYPGDASLLLKDIL